MLEARRLDLDRPHLALEADRDLGLRDRLRDVLRPFDAERFLERLQDFLPPLEEERFLDAERFLEAERFRERERLGVFLPHLDAERLLLPTERGKRD